MLSDNCNTNLNNNTYFGSHFVLIRSDMGGCKLDLSGLGYDKWRAVVNPEINNS